ncbi:MAG: CDP-alcohol phosphatidyltransferase family protein [Candidatus ainarchaeum sp.]|nr:CDP-alcohol phosphatidyltransferase family protein [Candidatus ainarchaeum sp.]
MLRASFIGKDISKALEKVFKHVPLHPNVITIGSVLFAVAGYFAYFYSQWGAVALFALALFMDAVDGAVARARRLETRKGAFLDGIADRLVEFIIILTLILQVDMPDLFVGKSVWLIFTLFFGTCMTSFVKAYAEHRQIMGHMDAVKMPGLLERAERVVLLMIVFVLAILKNEWAIPLLAITALLSLITFAQRFLHAMMAKSK